LDAIFESIGIVHIVPDEDGSLKVKQFEQFHDSKVLSDLSQPMGAAIATAQANK